MLRELRPRARRAELIDVARLITTIIDGALVQVPSRTFVADAVAAVLRIARGVADGPATRSAFDPKRILVSRV